MASEAARPITGVAAGVPFLAIPPHPQSRASAPVVVAWHLMDPPRTEPAFAAALPLDGLDAWRVYLGLPLTGSRLPPGGLDELVRLGSEDAVQNLYGPITAQAAREFEGALAALRATLELRDGPIAAVGGSIGAAVAQLVLAKSNVPISAAVLISPVVQLEPVVDVMARRFGFAYPWSPASRAIAHRLDFVARSDELARRGEPAVLLVVGEDDDTEAVRAPAIRLHDALAARYADPIRVQVVVISGMAHALASEPGIAAAPQTAHAAAVDRHAVAFLQRHLTPG